MTFVHLDKLKDFDLTAKTIDGVRYYDTPSGKPMPSITSVTSFYNRKVFQDWRLVLVKKKLIKFPEYPLVGDPCFMNWLRFI